MTNRRGKRWALGVLAVGLVVVLGLAMAHWKTIVDHFEAWRFQLTRKTETIEPAPGGWLLFEEDNWSYDLAGCLLVVATFSGLPAIIESGRIGKSQFDSAPRSDDPPLWSFLTEAKARRLLMENGYRILEQRFPRRAHVLIRDERTTLPSRTAAR